MSTEKHGWLPACHHLQCAMPDGCQRGPHLLLRKDALLAGGSALKIVQGCLLLVQQVLQHLDAPSISNLCLSGLIWSVTSHREVYAAAQASESMIAASCHRDVSAAALHVLHEGNNSADHRLDQSESLCCSSVGFPSSCTSWWCCTVRYHAACSLWPHHISLPPMGYISPGVPALGRLPTLHTRSRTRSCTQPASLSSVQLKSSNAFAAKARNTQHCRQHASLESNLNEADLQLPHLCRGSAGGPLQFAGLFPVRPPGPWCVCGCHGSRSAAGREPPRLSGRPKQSGIE